jgi:HAMP domain-containing protein
MRQFTIAERLIAAVLLSLSAMAAVPSLAAMLVPMVGEANAGTLRLALGLAATGLTGAAVLAIARGIAGPLAKAADTIDAIAYAELASAPPAPPGRGEVARLTSATDRLAEVIGERQRRELVHNDLERAWQAARRDNLSNLAHEVEIATEGGIQPIVAGAAALQGKAEDMLSASIVMREASARITASRPRPLPRRTCSAISPIACITWSDN